MPTFRDLETAAYCPRKLYYRRREPETDRTVPPDVRERQALAFRYSILLEDDAAVADAPLSVAPATFRSRLGAARARLDCWDELSSPDDREVRLVGRDCRGVADKVLDTDPPAPTVVFAGAPPTEGVWHPQRVRVIAATRALAWERETSVPRGFAEYPAHGVVREVPVDARRAGEYRAALRTARTVDGPPARVANRAKCDPCEYRETCGVRTRSLRSRL